MVITAAAFEAAREDRTASRAFLHRMPKGGDLHTHLGGAVYAERFIAWAVEQGLCVDLRNVVLAKPQCDRAGAVPVSDAMRDQALYNRMVDAFSMALVPANSRRAHGPRRILRRLRKIRNGIRLAFRRHDGRPAQALRQPERAIRRVHGVVVVSERARAVRLGSE